MKLMPKLRGFTLIELLITVSIISILSAIGLVVFNNVIKQGRDSKRQSDLRSIQSAVEQYYADHLSYPVRGNSCLNGTLRLGCSLKSLDGTKTYMNTVPTDPTEPNNLNGYYYVPFTSLGGICNSAGNCTTYCLYAKLSSGSSIPAACSPPPQNSYTFAVTPP